MPDDEDPDQKFIVMFNGDGHISMGKSDGEPIPFGTTMFEHWTVVASDLSREDAQCYVRMNWKDMTPYSVAKTMRSQKKYRDLNDEEFDALWYRMTPEEYFAAKPEFLEKEKREEARKQAEEEAKKAAAESA